MLGIVIRFSEKNYQSKENCLLFSFYDNKISRATNVSKAAWSAINSEMGIQNKHHKNISLKVGSEIYND